MPIQNQRSTSVYNIAVDINGLVGDLKLVDEKQKTLQIGAGANGLIVIHVVLNQILQMITNHGADIERLHREWWEWVIKSHVIVLLNRYGIWISVVLFLLSRVQSHRRSQRHIPHCWVWQDKFGTWHSYHWDCRDDSRPNLWRKICSISKCTNVENESISFRHLCKSSSFATGCSSLVVESVETALAWAPGVRSVVFWGIPTSKTSHLLGVSVQE